MTNNLGYLGGSYPITTVTPFSYRSGATMMEIMERFKKWALEMGPEVQLIIDTALNGWKDEFDVLDAKVNTTLAEWQTLFEAFMADVVAQLEALNDQASANLVESELSSLRAALNSLFVQRSELYEFAPLPSGGDDTQALSQAAERAFTKNPDSVLFIPAGNYKITGSVNIKCALDASQAAFMYTGTGDALIIGDVATQGSVTSRKTFILPRLIRTNAQSYDGSSRGVRLVNINSCTVISQFIQHFEEGIVAEGYYQGSVHNIIYPGTLWGNRRNIVLRKGTSGWVNENLWIGGRLSGPAWGFPDDPLSNYILVEDMGALGSPNANRFMNVSLEGPNKHLYRVDLAGNYNVLEFCRWEHAASETVRIRYSAGANYSVLNGGYMQQLVEEVFAGPTIGNVRTVQSNAIYAISTKVNATTVESGVDTAVSSWVPPTGFYFTYDASKGAIKPRPGRYMVKVRLSFNTAYAEGLRTVRIFNDSAVVAVSSVPGGLGTQTVECSIPINFNGTNTVSVQVGQTSGQPAQLTSSLGYSLFSLELIK